MPLVDRNSNTSASSTEPATPGPRPLRFKTTCAVLAVAAIAAVVFLALAVTSPDPIVCPDCLDPTRPLNYTCGDDINPGPRFLDGRINPYGTNYIGCNL
jgi:hypothetical protein